MRVLSTVFWTVLFASLALPGHTQRVEPLDLATLASDQVPTLVRSEQPLRLVEAEGLEAAVSFRSAAEAAPEQLAALAARNRETPWTPANGFSRPLAPSIRFGGEPTLASRRVARSAANASTFATRVEVDGAWRVRLHLNDISLPEGAQLWIYSGDEVVQFQAAHVESLWTPSVAGPDVRLEVQLPAGDRSDARELFRIDEVLELFPLDASGAPVVTTEDVSTGCLRDASCYGTNRFPGIDAARGAVAHIQYVSPQGPRICTGTLINDADDSTVIPYFVTAYHCISEASVAGSAEFFFDYRTNGCNGALPNPASIPRVFGASLVATSPESDHALLRLSGFPDNNRWLLGWDARQGVTPPGTKLYRVSHPMGFPQHYSETTVSSINAPCFDSADYLSQDRGLGGTLGGSSGSAVLTSDGLIVGQLFGLCGSNPTEGCSNENWTVDGRLSASFQRVGWPLLPRNTSSCVPSGSTLCIDDGPGDRRFEVNIVWESDRNGGIGGLGQAIGLKPIGISAGGLFWFFGASNPEVLVKVLNACVINNHYWAFFSAGTDVAFTLRIRDTVTGLYWLRSNADLSSALPVSDIAAFPCS